MKTVLALFDRPEDAERAIERLHGIGVPREDISLLMRGTTPEELAGDHAARTAEGGMVGGASIGGIAGLVIGLGALVVPGIGPVLSAGAFATALASTVAGAGIGAAAGGILGALAGLGVPDEEAAIYAEGVERGGTLLSVQTDEDRVAEIDRVMTESGAVDISTRREGEEPGRREVVTGDAHPARQAALVEMEDEGEHEMAMSPHGGISIEECIARCLECHRICSEMIRHCLRRGEEHADPEHIGYLIDCAQACQSSADFMIRRSRLHVEVCGVCALACLRCAESCSRIADDDMMERCAATCYRCADSCRQMAGM